MTLHLTTKVLPGNRIVLQTDQLREGQDVEVTITPRVGPNDSSPVDVLEHIRTLPPGPRSADTWEELEANIRKERDSWRP